MRRAADAGTALFLSCALANALGAAGLARAFGYPDLLHNPASATLAALGDRVALLTLLAGLTALSAFLLVPLTTRVIRLGHSPPSPTRPQPGPPLSITTAEIRRARAADLTTIAEPRPAAGDHSAPSDQSAVSDQLAVSGPSTGGDHSDAGAGEGTPRAGGGRAAPWLLLGVALAASTTMIFECSLWLVGVPMLAHPAEIPGRIAPEVLTFDALRVVAGVGCGETLGPLLLAIWTGLVATRFTDRLAGAHGTSGGWNQPAYAVPRRSGLAGLLLARTWAWADRLRLRGRAWSRPLLVGGGLTCAALLVAGAAVTVGLLPGAPVALLARMVWSLWLAAVGLMVWNRRTVLAGDPWPAAGRRGLALGSPPPLAGPPAGGWPRYVERIPYRFAAYEAARRRGQPLPRPEHPGLPGPPRSGTSGPDPLADALTVAGDDVVVDLAGSDHEGAARTEYPGRPGRGDRKPGGASRPPADGAVEDLDPPTEIVDPPAVDGPPAPRGPAGPQRTAGRHDQGGRQSGR